MPPAQTSRNRSGTSHLGPVPSVGRVPRWTVPCNFTLPYPTLPVPQRKLSSLVERSLQRRRQNIPIVNSGSEQKEQVHNMQTINEEMNEAGSGSNYHLGKG